MPTVDQVREMHKLIREGDAMALLAAARHSKAFDNISLGSVCDEFISHSLFRPRPWSRRSTQSQIEIDLREGRIIWSSSSAANIHNMCPFLD
jgi:hypothetical protein